MKKIVAVLCVLALVLTMVPMTVFADASVEFAILSTTDMHGRCWDTNVLTEGSDANNMLKVKTAVNQIRGTYGADNVFVIDNGDLYQGTPVSTYQLNQYSQGLSTEPLAMALCLADIGYTASVLGNHEFNHPWGTMEAARSYLDENGVSPVCGNLYFEATGDPVFTPYITREIAVGDKTLKIGILGMESTDCPRWDIPDNYPGIIFHHPDNPTASIAWEVNRYVPAMQEEGCDFIIVSYHGGTGSATGELVFGTNTESQATRMIAETEGVDMVIAGHDHSTSYSNTYLKNKNGEDVLIVNGGGSALTESVFTATATEDGITVTVKSSKNLALSNYASDADLKAKIAPYAEAASAYVNQEAGKCIGTWDTERSFYLKQSNSMDLIQAAQIATATKHIAEKYNTEEKINALYEQTGLDHLDVDMSSTSVVVNGSYTVKSGSMSMKDIYRLYKYDNNLYILPLTGAQIKAVLEQNASTRLKATLRNGTVSYSTIGEDFTNPVFGGLNFTYDMYQPEGSRVIIEGFSNGRAFDLEKVYLVGVNNYHLGNVGCGFGAYTTSDSIWSQTDDMGGGVVQDLIMEYLTDVTADKGGVDPATTFTWHWKLDYTGDTSEVPTLAGDIIAKKVTELADGDKILIYYDADGTVMGTEPAENTARLGAVGTTSSGDYIGTNAPAAIFTVEITSEDGAERTEFALKTESGNYLTSGATGNSLGFAAELSDLGKWYLTAVEGGWHIMSVGANYNGNYNQALEWYSGFTTYGVKDTSAYLFNLYTPVETASLASEVKNGGKYIIFYDAEETCLSTTANAGGLAPVTNTRIGSKILLPVDETTLIVTANIGEDGKIAFVTDGGKYLTAPAAGNGLSLEDTAAENELSLWTTVAVEGGWHVMNVGAAYNGNHNQALEYYSGKFTTYGVKDTGAYLFNFYELGEGEELPCTHETTEVRDAVEASCIDAGYSGDTYCTACGEKLSEGTAIDALGHDWDDGVPMPTATADILCNTELFCIFTCKRCGETKWETVPAADCPTEDYTDVERLWYHDAVDYVVSSGIMGSTKQDVLTFEPTTTATRAMIVQILYALEGKPEVSGALPFTDVSDTAWYYNAVRWAVQNALISGYGNGKLGPNDVITREQLATMLKAYASFKGLSTSQTAELSSFPDAANASWSKPYMEWAVAIGILSGKGVGEQTMLVPQGKASRAEVAMMLYRFIPAMNNMERLADTEACEHTYEVAAAVEPSCEVMGYKVHVCSKCSAARYYEELAPLGHTDVMELVDATCYNAGGEKYTCTVCGRTYIVEQTPALEHNFNTDGYCTRCYGLNPEAKFFDKLIGTWYANVALNSNYQYDTYQPQTVKLVIRADRTATLTIKNTDVATTYTDITEDIFANNAYQFSALNGSTTVWIGYSEQPDVAELGALMLYDAAGNTIHFKK